MAYTLTYIPKSVGASKKASYAGRIEPNGFVVTLEAGVPKEVTDHQFKILQKDSGFDKSISFGSIVVTPVPMTANSESKGETPVEIDGESQTQAKTRKKPVA